MMDYKKYKRQYFMPPEPCRQWAEKEYVDRAPDWCSVDLRDGNQSLIVPMSLEKKLAFFDLLVAAGFKEIEVGFPAASDTEYRFVRTLIEQNRIPEDVTIQVLTQAREHIIQQTFDALEGARRATVHIYNSISPVQRERVFRKSEKEILDLTVYGAELVREMNDRKNCGYGFEYSPESFSSTEPEYALEVCNAVLDVWQPREGQDIIINLPGTVELALPHVFASQVEYIGKNLKYREHVRLSVHTHNDRGTAAAAAELGLLAGAQRIEGTMFGNGERAGNVDLVTLAMNLYAQGVDPGLHFDDLPGLRDKYEEYTGMPVPERSPYSGALAFAAFSGSHQDAIAKSLKYQEEHGEKIWSVPYLPIDPADVCHNYDADIIRINSQSGKGGVGFVLEQHFGLRLPKKMREAMGYAAKDYSDRLHKELVPEELFELFKNCFENSNRPLAVKEVHFRQHNGVLAEVTTTLEGRQHIILSTGNGRLNAVSNALKKHFKLEYEVDTYEEHALEKSSSSRAIAYVGILDTYGRLYWGAGLHADILRASIDALTAAINNMLSDQDMPKTGPGYYPHPVRRA